MRITSIRVLGFRSLADVGPLPLKDLAVLVGPNDAGKSATLAALAFFLGGGLNDADRTLSGSAAPLGDGGSEPSPVVPAETLVEACLATSRYERDEFGLPGELRVRRRATPGAEPVYERLVEVCEDPELRAIDTATIGRLKELAEARALEVEGNRRLRATFADPVRELRDSLPTVKEWTECGRELIARLPQLLTFASTAQPDPEAQVRVALRAAYAKLIEDVSVRRPLAEIEAALRAQLTVEAEELCEHVMSRCPELSDVRAVPKVSFSGGFSDVSLHTTAAGSNEVELRRSGAGHQQRVTLAVWEWASSLIGSRGDRAARDTVVTYDEPDTHLDYQRQRSFLDLVRDQGNRDGVQVIVATHSLNLLDRIDLADVIGLRRDGTRTVTDELTDESHESHAAFSSGILESLGLRNSVVLNERCFLVVEGDTEKRVLPVLFRLHAGCSFQTAGIALMACGGNEGALAVAKFLTDQQRVVIFLLDADSGTQPSTRKLFSSEKLTAYGIPEERRLYVGKPNELEELFCDEQWAAAANAHWPRDDGQDWKPEDIGAARAGQKFSSDLVELFRLGSSSGPRGKPDMLAALVDDMTSAEDVPAELRASFDAVLAAIES